MRWDIYLKAHIEGDGVRAVFVLVSCEYECEFERVCVDSWTVVGVAWEREISRFCSLRFAGVGLVRSEK